MFFFVKLSVTPNHQAEWLDDALMTRFFFRTPEGESKVLDVEASWKRVGAYPTMTLVLCSSSAFLFPILSSSMTFGHLEKCAPSGPLLCERTEGAAFVRNSKA